MKPRVIVHCAVSIDGRTQGFQPDTGLFYEVISLWNEDATLAGCDTLLAAPGAPAEDTTHDLAPHVDRPGDPRPLLVVPDSRGRLRSWQYWLGFPYWRGGLALVTRATPAEYREYLEHAGVDALVCGDERVDYTRALDHLSARLGVRTLRVDSGGTLSGLLMAAGLVDEVSLLVHPVVVGGGPGRTAFQGTRDPVPFPPNHFNLAHVEKLRGEVGWLRWKKPRTAPAPK